MEEVAVTPNRHWRRGILATRKLPEEKYWLDGWLCMGLGDWWVSLAREGPGPVPGSSVSQPGQLSCRGAARTWGQEVRLERS